MAESCRTLCNRDCPDACGIIATVEQGRVVRLRGDPAHPVTRGFLCSRTRRFLARQYAADRITEPLMRRTPGAELAAVSWDEALDAIGTRLLKIRDESGPEAILHYRGGGSLGLLLVLVDRFFAHFGPVTTTRGNICDGAGQWAQEHDFGTADSSDVLDLVHASNILLWGKNATVSSPHLVPVLNEAARHGAELVLIDPVLHATARLCDTVWQVRPGGDLALAMAVGRVLIEQDWTDPDAASYCDNLPELRRLALSRSVEQWCAAANLPTAAAADLARRLGPGKPTSLLVGWGLGRRRWGATTVRALDALAAISGNLGIPGGGVSRCFHRGGAFDVARVVGANRPARTIAEPLFGQHIAAATDPPIRAAWVTAANPVAMLPDAAANARALRGCELVVVTDSFLTDTARLAHVVLPTPTLLEDDNILGAYGHHWIGVSRPVVPPPPGVKSDLEIMQALAARVGLSEVMAGDASAWKERLLSERVRAKGLTLQALDHGVVRNPLAEKVLFASRRFATPSGRVQLLAHLPEGAADPEPVERRPAASVVQDGEGGESREGNPRNTDPTYPLFLLSLSTSDAQSSQWAVPLEGPVEARIHPRSAAGLADGSVAQLESPIGSMPVRLRHDAQQRPDVVIVPKGGHVIDQRCANLLVKAELTDAGEGGVLYDQRVRIVARLSTRFSSR